MKRTVLALTVFAAFSASATTTDYQKQIDDLRAGLHDVHMNTLQKYSESWGLEDRANIAKLQSDKVDKSVFTADQQRQDKALADAVTKQGQTDAKQTSDLKSYADKKATSAYQTSVAHTDTKVARADADRLKGDQQLQANLDSESAERSKADAELGRNVENSRARIAGAERNISSLYSSVDSANAFLRANEAAIGATNKAVAANSAQLANHEQRIQKLESQTTSRFADMNRRMDNMQDKFDAGLAGVAAMANIPQVTEYQTFAIGAGVGARESESAVAVGASFRASQNTVIKASVAGDSQQTWTVGAGLSYGW